MAMTQKLPSWELTYPTHRRGQSSCQQPLHGDTLVPWEGRHSAILFASGTSNPVLGGSSQLVSG